MHSAKSNEAAVYLARAEQGDEASREFVDAALQKWTAQLGEYGPQNPYGVTPSSAVTFELVERDKMISGIAGESEKAFRLGGLSPDQAYHRLAGEVEARAVQSRMDLSPEQRAARAPWLDYDVPVDQQIVRGVEP